MTNLEFHTPHIFPSLSATSSNQQNIAHQLENSDASNTPHAPTDSSSHRTFNHHSKIHFLFVSPLSHLFLCFTQSPLFLCFLGTIFNPLNLGAPTFSCRHCGSFLYYFLYPYMHILFTLHSVLQKRCMINMSKQ